MKGEIYNGPGWEIGRENDVYEDDSCDFSMNKYSRVKHYYTVKNPHNNWSKPELFGTLSPIKSKNQKLKSKKGIYKDIPKINTLFPTIDRKFDLSKQKHLNNYYLQYDHSRNSQLNDPEFKDNIKFQNNHSDNFNFQTHPNVPNYLSNNNKQMSNINQFADSPIYRMDKSDTFYRKNRSRYGRRYNLSTNCQKERKVATGPVKSQSSNYDFNFSPLKRLRNNQINNNNINNSLLRPFTGNHKVPTVPVECCISARKDQFPSHYTRTPVIINKNHSKTSKPYDIPKIHFGRHSRSQHDDPIYRSNRAVYKRNRNSNSSHCNVTHDNHNYHDDQYGDSLNNGNNRYIYYYADETFCNNVPIDLGSENKHTNHGVRKINVNDGSILNNNDYHTNNLNINNQEVNYINNYHIHDDRVTERIYIRQPSEIEIPSLSLVNNDISDISLNYPNDININAINYNSDIYDNNGIYGNSGINTINNMSDNKYTYYGYGIDETNYTNIHDNNDVKNYMNTLSDTNYNNNSSDTASNNDGNELSNNDNISQGNDDRSDNSHSESNSDNTGLNNDRLNESNNSDFISTNTNSDSDREEEIVYF